MSVTGTDNQTNMGTRGHYGFRYKGRIILFYNHWDSYCEGLGQMIRDELAKFTDATYKALMKRILQLLRDGTIKEGMSTLEGKNYEGLMNAIQQPDMYALVYVGRTIPPKDGCIEYTYIVDLDNHFLRVITLEDRWKFPLDELPDDMAAYEESDEVDTDLEESVDDE